MTIPINRKLLLKILLIANILYWMIHLTLFCLPFYRYMPKYGVSEWCQLAYNVVSIMAVFYSTAYFTHQWLNAFSVEKFMELSLSRKVFYVINKQFFKILMVMVAYLVVSLLLDNEFFGQQPYTDMPLQLERRLSRVNAYVLGGPFYAVSLFLVKMLIKRVRALETENRNLYNSVFEIENLYKALKKEIATN